MPRISPLYLAKSSGLTLSLEADDASATVDLCRVRGLGNGDTATVRWSLAGGKETVLSLHVKRLLQFAMTDYPALVHTDENGRLIFDGFSPFFSYGYFTDTVGGLKSFLLIEALAIFALLIYFAGLSVFSMGKLEYKTVSQALTAVIYVTVSFSSLCQLRYLENGGYLFALVFIGAWTCDTFAYFTGMLFGRHKLCPVLSPKKTVEGSIGGTVFAILGFIVYGLIIESATALSANYLYLALCGLLVAVVSQLGDLFASLIKREYGVKDYSKLLPGHGGIMDRFDSIIAVSTVLLVISILLPPFTMAA